MSLYDEIIEIYPQLTNEDFATITGTIGFRDDNDGAGEYIEKWDNELPIPSGFKLGK